MPRNVRRREKRKDEKVLNLKKEIKGLRQELARKDKVISEKESSIEKIKCQKKNVIQKLKQKYELAVLDFMHLDQENSNLKM